MATINDIVLGCIIFTVVFIGGVVMYSDIYSTYGGEAYYNNTYSDKNSAYFNQSTNDIEKINNLTIDVAEKLNANQVSLTSIDSVAVGGYNALIMMQDIFDLTRAIINSIALALHIPNWIVTAILMTILIVTIMAIIAAVLSKVIL